jgi:predicted RNA-binding Zn-ribbon protein involved in translation (DUF1610 family)
MSGTPKNCDECGSTFFADKSEMERLCPNCSHFIYGYPNCDHRFENDRCKICGWDGSLSTYVQQLKTKQPKNWKPIDKSELLSLVNEGLLKMNEQQLSIWKEISVEPEKWK